MSSQGPETALVKRIRATIAQRYPESFTYKTVGTRYSAAGMPDILVVVDGYLVALEVKAPRPGESDAGVLSRVTPLQWDTIGKIRKAGGIAEVVWDVDQALEAINRLVPKKTAEDNQRDARLYLLANQEDRLRKTNERLEEEVRGLRLENHELRSKISD